MHTLGALLLPLLLAGGAWPVAGRLLLVEPAAGGNAMLRVGFGVEPRVPMSSWENGQAKGFEALLIEAMAQEAGYNLEIVPLETLDDRFKALMDGRVDAVINSFTITPDRKKLVQFVMPSYYSAGAALFAPGGEIQGVRSWEDLSGQTVAVLEGNYVIDAAPQTPALQNVTLLQVADVQEASDAVLGGEAVGYIDDSSSLFAAPNLTIVSEVQPILRNPYSVAVTVGNDELAHKLSDALLALVEGGADAPILKMEQETFIAAGAPPNPDLAELVSNPTPGNSTLFPQTEVECAPVPSDSIWLPSDNFQPVHVWKIEGVQNWTCDPKSGNYSYTGWLVNATDSKTGVHTGYALTVPGPSGTHVPFFVATDERNATVLGTLINVREAGSVDMPSPSNPVLDTFWYRRPAYDQTGVFADPKVLFLTKTDTKGGVLPPGTPPCKEGDPMISVPVKAIFTFYACRQNA
ncbi:ABC transporter permease [Chlorella sorokiniana]|uniref:ABC transporter permease n=1 Tax=Chlorella sorokiniana TaxID=3076 RepID=A0A2P6TKG5_CHLSO|nr:ABC transporter permease [Chlorella sorokiniana]|eukprot:PRW44565.1 ABC transporter permease [Chlorella sorokiniana]